MKILSVSVRNFRLLHEFDLSLNESASDLVFINGSNGHGKTSLLGAFRFCFFDEEVRSQDFSYAELEKLPNGGSSEISVTVKFGLGSDGNFAIVTRTQRVQISEGSEPVLQGSSNLDVTLAFGDSSRPAEVHPDPESWLERNLPSRFKNFFLFDGELMYKFFDVSVKGAIENAVKEIAQIDLFEEILGYVRANRNSVGAKLAKISGTDAEKLQKSLIASRDLRDQIVANARKVAEQKQKLKERHIELSRLLEAHKDASKFLERNKELQESLNRLGNQRKNIEETMNKEIMQAGIAAFLVSRSDYPLQKHIRIADERGKYPADFKPDALEKLLAQNSCLCGRHLDETSEARHAVEHLLERSKSAGPLGKELQYLRDSLLVSRGVAIKSADSVESNKVLLREVLQELKRLKAEKDLLEPKIEGIKGNAENIHKLSMELKQIDAEILEIDAAAKRSAVEYERAESQLKSDQKKFEKATASSEEAMRLRIRLDFLDTVIEESDGFSGKVLEGVRQNLEIFVSSRFSKVKQGKFMTRITDDFEVLTLNQDGTIASLSEGQKMLKAYIFSIALREVVGLNFPLIVDTPFGRIDERNREALAESLCELIDPSKGGSQQVIFMMHDGEYTPYTKRHFDNVTSSENYLELLGPGNESRLKTGIDPQWLELTAWSDWHKGVIK